MRAIKREKSKPQKKNLESCSNRTDRGDDLFILFLSFVSACSKNATISKSLSSLALGLEIVENLYLDARAA